MASIASRSATPVSLEHAHNSYPRSKSPQSVSSAHHPPLYFTVVQDTTTSAAAQILDAADISSEAYVQRTRTKTYHPRVHYIFSDDADDPTHPSPLSSATTQPHSAKTQIQSPSSSRTIIVDFADDGCTIIGATSLSPDWQVTRANTSSLAMRSSSSSSPSSAFAARGGNNIGKMLTIEGVGASEENYNIISGRLKKSGMQGSGSVADTELANAFMYADLYSQTYVFFSFIFFERLTLSDTPSIKQLKA